MALDGHFFELVGFGLGDPCEVFFLFGPVAVEFAGVVTTTLHLSVDIPVDTVLLVALPDALAGRIGRLSDHAQGGGDIHHLSVRSQYQTPFVAELGHVAG